MVLLSLVHPYIVSTLPKNYDDSHANPFYKYFIDPIDPIFYFQSAIRGGVNFEGIFSSISNQMISFRKQLEL